jgi:hypothetical protein
MKKRISENAFGAILFVSFVVFSVLFMPRLELAILLTIGVYYLLYEIFRKRERTIEDVREELSRGYRREDDEE